MQVQWLIILKIEYLFHAYFLKFFFFLPRFWINSIISSLGAVLTNEASMRFFSDWVAAIMSKE